MLASLLIAQAFAAGRRKFLMPGGEVIFGEDNARAFLEAAVVEPVNRIGNVPAKKKAKRVPKVINEVRLRHALDEAEDRARQRDDDDLIAIILAME